MHIYKYKLNTKKIICFNIGDLVRLKINNNHKNSILYKKNI